MTYRATAYETIACSGAMTNRITDAISETYGGGLLNAEYCEIVEINGEEKWQKVPSFFHPIRIKDNIYVDVRPFVSFDKFTQETIIKNQPGYKLTCFRGAVNKIWITERPAYLRDLSPLPIATYTAWLSENIARRFALDGDAQYRLSILAAIFYNSHFIDDKELSTLDKQHLASYLSRQLKFNGDDVYTTLNQYSVINSIDEFCVAAREVTGSISLEQLNKGTLISVINNTFFGINASELAAVAIEHPPTWMCIIFDAIQNNNFYKKTVVGTILNRKHFDESRLSYSRGLLSMLKHFQ